MHYIKVSLTTSENVTKTFFLFRQAMTADHSLANSCWQEQLENRVGLSFQLTMT
jgi:hypothetical protein